MTSDQLDVMGVAHRYGQRRLETLNGEQTSADLDAGLDDNGFAGNARDLEAISADIGAAVNPPDGLVLHVVTQTARVACGR